MLTHILFLLRAKSRAYAFFLRSVIRKLGFLGGSDGKESAYNVGDFIPGLERSPGGHGSPL